MPGKFIAADQFASWGRKLASDYAACARAGKPMSLTEGVKKIAVDNGLLPEQVRRVAEAANVATFQEMLPDRGTGDVRFDPANADEIIKSANLGPTKMAVDLSDYYGPPKPRPSDFRKVAEANFGPHLGAVVSDLEKRASQEAVLALDEADRPLTAQTLPAFIRKLAAAKHELELERMDIARLTKEALDTFKEIVRQMVTEGYAIEDLYKAAQMTRPDARQYWNEIFGHIISDLDHRGYFGTKKASVDPKTGAVKIAEPVDPSLISERLDSLMPDGTDCVVSSSHMMTKQVNVLGDLWQNYQKNKMGLPILTDRLERAKSLSTSIGSGTIRGV